MPEEKVTVVESVDNAVLYSDGSIMLKMVRLSHPHVFVAKAQKNDKGELGTEKFSCQGLMPKTTHDAAKKLCVKVINKILSDKGPNGTAIKLAADRKFLKDGDPKDEDDATKPEHAGMWVFSSSEVKAPTVLDKFKDRETGKLRRMSKEKDLDKIYGGCWGNVLIRPWWQDNSYGKRINAGLVSVQFVKDDTPFGQGRISDEEIDDRFGAGEDEEGDAYDPADDL